MKWKTLVERARDSKKLWEVHEQERDLKKKGI